MAVLMNLALSLILGILQVSSNEYKDIHIGNTACEVKCFEKTTALCECNAGWKFLKEDLVAKDQVIQELEGVLAAANQCCGKESEERKCLEETVMRGVLNLIDGLSVFQQVYRGVITQTLANISLLATYAENELDCCCKHDFCVPKIELPTSSYKRSIKECKCENCAGAFNALLAKIPEFLDRAITARLLQGRLLGYHENLQRMKEDIPKGGKCKERKGLAALRKEIRNFNLYLKWLIALQAVQNTEGMVLLQDAANAARNILECPSEKDSKHYYPC